MQTHVSNTRYITMQCVPRYAIFRHWNEINRRLLLYDFSHSTSFKSYTPDNHWNWKQLIRRTGIAISVLRFNSIFVASCVSLGSVCTRVHRNGIKICVRVCMYVPFFFTMVHNRLKYQRNPSLPRRFTTKLTKFQ